MAKQGEGYWIRAKDGDIDRVTKHEQWLKNKWNLKKWDLEPLGPELAKYNEFNKAHVDEIRMIGLRAGLIRVRENMGTISIQFWAPRQKVSDYLYNTAQALKSVNLYGLQAYVHNLYYNDSVVIPWQEFLGL